MVIELAGLSCPQWVSYIFGIFSEFVDNFDLPDAVEKKKKASRVLICIAMMHNPAKFRFSTLKNQSAKMIPNGRVNYSPGLPKSSLNTSMF